MVNFRGICEFGRNKGLYESEELPQADISFLIGHRLGDLWEMRSQKDGN